jgi:hypothetical protein
MAEEPYAEGDTPPEEAQNRTFIILAIALGGVFLIGLLCIGVYIIFIGPRQQQARLAAAAAVMTQNAQIALDATASAMPTSTPPDTPTEPPTATASPTEVIIVPTTPPPPTSTPTPIQVVQVTDTPSPTGPTPTGPTPTRTPTPLVGVLTPTRTPTPTRLPDTGFADEVGIPGLILLGFALVAVVIVARRLRLSLR